MGDHIAVNHLGAQTFEQAGNGCFPRREPSGQTHDHGLSHQLHAPLYQESPAVKSTRKGTLSSSAFSIFPATSFSTSASSFSGTSKTSSSCTCSIIRVESF